jgi:hypothetical protein
VKFLPKAVNASILTDNVTLIVLGCDTGFVISKGGCLVCGVVVVLVWYDLLHC